MKEYRKYYEPLATLIATFLLLDFLIAPGLTIPNTLINLISLFGLMVLFTVLISLFTGRFKNNFTEQTPTVEPGETELDYIPEEELKPKRPTAKAKVKKVVKEASVEDKPKKPKKSEFPIEPHKPRVTSKKSETTKSKATSKKK